MPKRYWWVVVTYVLMQFSGIIAIPLLGVSTGLANNELVGPWATISFMTALVVILVLLRADMAGQHLARDRASRGESILWVLIGIFIAFGAQAAAGIIEQQLLGIEPGSENTQNIAELARMAPYFMIIPAVVGPILEEVVFRKIIFGSLYKRTNFVIAALASSLIFGFAHLELKHLLVYTAMGFTFAFLYVKTKRIIVPIVAHVTMNSFVLLIQFMFADDIQKYMENLEKTQQFIGGF